MTVIIYSVGMVYLSACVPKDTPLDAVREAVNLEHPTGLTQGWRLSLDETFADGTDHPCPCPNDPTNRLHYLFEC